MLWKVDIKNKPHIFDAVGDGVKKDIRDLGIDSVKKVNFEQIFFLEGELKESDIAKICQTLLVDPVTQDFSYSSLRRSKPRSRKNNSHVIEIAYNPGVMDPVEESTKKAIADLGIDGVSSIKTAKRFLIKGRLRKGQLDFISEKILANKVIQHSVKGQEHELSVPEYKFKLIKVNLMNKSKAGLMEISRQGQLFLNVNEMLAIQKYFRKLKRNPTDVELETLAQTWSEHCGHKTFRGRIEYKEGEKTIKIDNLLKSTIMKVTKELNKPWCVSVFHDNSGVIRFDEGHNVCFKVETHNHPSALEPYGGAGTGIGGVIRDPLGTGLGAKPIINTDVFCFGPPDLDFKKVPKGVLHPKRIMKGVVSGVRDYGNRMGIPTANGAVLFDEGYIGNPLVYCGNVGIMPKDKSFKRLKTGDLIILIGGKTGRDGIHGATFSSGELTQESEAISSGAVQIGNPITEKKMADCILKARDRNLYNAITDCGGGGLSSAVGEMGKDTGVRVDLEKVPLKYKGLSYTEIWISEAQERMILAVPKQSANKLISLFEEEEVEATIIGEFTNTKRLQLFYEGNSVCDLDMKFLHNGIPQIVKKGVWAKPRLKEPKFSQPKNLTADLLKILSDWNVCSKEWVIRQYDHEVQGGSVIKPLVGKFNDGPGDACVTQPILDSKKGLILGCGINPNYGKIDPYWMSASAIDEALRQVVSAGGNIKRAAILDNFCWGNPDRPDVLGGLVRAAFGCYETAKGFEVPFISGKDSLNNEYKVGAKSIAIPGTLLISCIAVIDDVTRAVSMDAKREGNLIYIVGLTFNELGGSQYFKLRNYLGNSVPKVRFPYARKLMGALSQASEKGLVESIHDCSEGGIGVAAAEMAFAGDLGMRIDLKKVPQGEKVERSDYLLFSESNSRFIVEVKRKNKAGFEKTIKKDFALIGKITKEKKFEIIGLDGKKIASEGIEKLKKAWQDPLRW